MNIKRQRLLLLVGVVAGANFLPMIATRADDSPPSLAFIAAGKEYHFDTGTLRGTLRAGGQSRGLGPVTAIDAGKTISGVYGLLSPYRLLTADTRFGTAAWDWASQARLLEDRAVEAHWQADGEHPLDMTATYRLAAADTIELTLSVKPKRTLRGFELFLASYFDGFEQSSAYVVAGPRDSRANPRLVEAKHADGYWQVFPRDGAAKQLYSDGRWKRPPNPVDWVVRQPLAAPLAVRRDRGSGLAAVLMAPAGDCFALAMPYGEEPHRSVYLSLFGRDVKADELAVARVRLVVRRGLSDEKAAQLYGEFSGQKH
jgi:hypothetical protein